jgi:hypothetical protein
MSKHVIPTSTNGNCAFCAIAIGWAVYSRLYRRIPTLAKKYMISDPEIRMATDKYRIDAANWLAEFDEILTVPYVSVNPDICTRRDVVLDIISGESGDEYVTCEDYLNHVSANYQWASLAEIYAMACILRVRIEIYHTNMKMYVAFDGGLADSDDDSDRDSSGSNNSNRDSSKDRDSSSSDLPAIKLVFHPYGTGTHYAVWLDEDEHAILHTQTPTAKLLHTYWKTVGVSPDVAK